MTSFRALTALVACIVLAATSAACSDDSGLSGTSRASAQSIVRRAYLSVLKREPDPASEGYIERVLRDGWSQADVERDLRRSAEYRSRIQ